MTHVTITLPDGSRRETQAGVSVADFAATISPQLAKSALAGVVDGQTVDLSCPLDRDCALRIVTPESPEALGLYRHSTAHLMAAAVTNLFPGTQCGVGPATDEGFFYDFVVERPFVPEDLDAIEQKMRELAERNLRYERKMIPKEEAKAYFTRRGEPLKVELIEDKGGPVVSCYTIEDAFIDFCTGPHVPASGRLKAFKLLSTSNAYWKGDAHNQPMQRVYGTAFAKESELEGAPRSGSKKRRSATIASSGATCGCSSCTRGRRARPSGSRRARRSTTRSPTTCARSSSRPATRK